MHKSFSLSICLPTLVIFCLFFFFNNSHTYWVWSSVSLWLGLVFNVCSCCLSLKGKGIILLILEWWVEKKVFWESLWTSRSGTWSQEIVKLLQGRISSPCSCGSCRTDEQRVLVVAELQRFKGDRFMKSGFKAILLRKDEFLFCAILILSKNFYWSIVFLQCCVSAVKQSESAVCVYIHIHIYIHIYIYIYRLSFFGYPYHLCHHRALSRVPCALQ